MYLFNEKFNKAFNSIILPIKLIIPQPLIKQIPYLTTNREIRVEKVLEHVKGRCLDIGCGDNELIKEYRSKGGNGIGIDVYPWDGVDKVVSDSSKLPFENKSFDCITFVASLNHIPNRNEVLKESYRILKEDGIIIITFLSPIISFLWHKICFWDQDQKKRGMKNGEVYGFTGNQVIALLNKTGYRIVEQKKFSWGLNHIYVGSKIL